MTEQERKTHVAAAGARQARLCFVIGPIGDPEGEPRKRSDRVLKHVFAKAVEHLGFTVERADKISQPGMITLQVLQRVMDAPLVIADLTDRNPNVFYELAVRHATEKPVIHVIDSGQTIPFDVSDFRTVKFDHTDLDSVERAVEEIRKQAQESESGHRAETPVKLAAVMQKLGAGGSELQGVLNVVLKEILPALTGLRADLQPLIEAEKRRGMAVLTGTLGGMGTPTFGSTSFNTLLGPSPSLYDLSQQLTDLRRALERKPWQAGVEIAEPESEKKSKG